MSMIDPPRAAVPDAVGKCRSAGIKVLASLRPSSQTPKVQGMWGLLPWGDPTTGGLLPTDQEEKLSICNPEEGSHLSTAMLAPWSQIPGFPNCKKEIYVIYKIPCLQGFVIAIQANLLKNIFYFQVLAIMDKAAMNICVKVLYGRFQLTKVNMKEIDFKIMW